MTKEQFKRWVSHVDFQGTILTGLVFGVMVTMVALVVRVGQIRDEEHERITQLEEQVHELTVQQELDRAVLKDMVEVW